MDPIIGAFIFAWLFMRGYEAVKGEWTHTRDNYANDIARRNPGWSPGRVRRNARHRARGYWWDQLANGFPTFRQAWKEHRLQAETERTEAAVEGESRLAELRKRLEDARRKVAERKHAAVPEAEPEDAGPQLPAAPEAEPSELPPGEPEAEAGNPPEPWTADPAPEGFGQSSWRTPGVPPCEGCGGTGSNRAGDDACPVCRGWGDAPPDPLSPEAPPGTVCTTCGNRERDGDPVLDTAGGPTHLSHAVAQTAAHWAALDQTYPDEPTPPEGDPMTTPATTAASVEDAETPYEGLQLVLGQQAKQAREAATHAQDEVVAYATTHGFDRDQQTMAQLQAIADAAEAHAAAAEGALASLVANHEEGAEYHGTGRDAHASAFRPA